MVFAAAASLCQALATDRIEMGVVGLFIGITLIGGGACSYLLGLFVNKMEREKVNMVLVGIVASLTCMSALSMAINVVLGYVNFGREFMEAADGICHD